MISADLGHHTLFRCKTYEELLQRMRLNYQLPGFTTLGEDLIVTFRNDRLVIHLPKEDTRQCSKKTLVSALRAGV